jgi:hypothetical protein
MHDSQSILILNQKSNQRDSMTRCTFGQFGADTILIPRAQAICYAIAPVSVKEGTKHEGSAI